MPGAFIDGGTSGGAALAVKNVAPASAAAPAVQEQPAMQQAVAGHRLERVERFWFRHRRILAASR